MQSDDRSILITGSSGLIGSALARRFQGSHRVIGMDRTPGERRRRRVHCYKVDLASQPSVEKTLAHIREAHGRQLTAVIHLAAYYDFSGEPSTKYEEITVQGTARLLGELHDMNFQVDQFLYASTMLVHAPCEPGQKIHEDSPLDPTWDYPRSKVLAEQVLQRDHGGIPLVILRIAGVYDDLCHSPPLANQIQRIHERWVTSKVFPGDTSRGQSFIHLDDLVEAIFRLVEVRRTLPEELTLLVGEPEVLSYDEIQRILGRLLHDEEWETRQVPKAVARAGAWVEDHLPLVEPPFIKPWMVDRAEDHFDLDIRRIQRLTGWSPRRNLRDTLPRMVASLEANPRLWYRRNKLKTPRSWRQEAA